MMPPLFPLSGPIFAVFYNKYKIPLKPINIKSAIACVKILDMKMLHLKYLTKSFREEKTWKES